MKDCKAEEAFSISKLKQKENLYLNNTDSGLKWQNETRKQSEKEPPENHTTNTRVKDNLNPRLVYILLKFHNIQ